MRSKIAVWINVRFKPRRPLGFRAARTGATTETMMTDSKISFFKGGPRVLMPLKTCVG